MKSQRSTEAEVSTGTLARLLSISENHLGKLATAGIVVRLGHNRFDLWQSVRGYIVHLQQRIRDGRSAPAEHTRELAQVKILEMRERANRLAMDNARARGEMVKVDEIMRAFGSCFIAARERILASSLLPEEKDKLIDDLRGILERQALHHERNGNGASPPVSHPGPAAPAELSAVG